MALTDKDIVITPNRGQSADPKVEFKGASSTLGPQTISLNVYPTSNGTLSFEGSAGQLFSVTNSLTGTIYSVNDVSGIPSIEVLDTGLVKLAQYNGNVLVGTGTDDGSKLQVRGSLRVGNGGWGSSPAGTTFSHTIAANTGNFRTVNFDGNGSPPSVWWTSGSRAYGAIDAQDPGLTFWANNGSAWQKQITMGYGTVNIDTALQQGGNQVLHANNYNSYAPTLTGGGASGTWGINITGSAATATDSTKLPLSGGTVTGRLFSSVNGRTTGYTGSNFEVYTGDNTPPGISFHRGGYSATLLYENDGELYTNPWTTRGQTGKLLAAGNYNSYAPTLTGGGASGTWGINITGNADTVDSYHVAVAGSANTIPTRNGSGYLEPNNWIQFNGTYGLYAPTNDAHFYPNDQDYGSWRIRGTRNGWYGIYFDSGSTLMMNSNNVGFHRSAYGWQMRWYAGVGYISKNDPGGGTEAVILDAANYTNYTNGIFLRAAGHPGYGDWNTFGNTQQTVHEIYQENFNAGTNTGSSNFPTSRGYSYGTLVNFGANSSARAQVYISHAGNDLIFRGGWGTGSWQTWNRVLTDQIYNSYSPTLTGGGASGTWGINITGSAGSVPASGITGQVGMWTSAQRPGPYRLYRRDDNSDFSVQTYWTGARWRLYGYNGDTGHADTHVGYADSAGSSGSSGDANYLISADNRTIAPSEDTAFRMRFGFTSWNNNGDTGETYADYLHLRSYNDSSGGLDNLVMFRKTGGIGMRIWQQTFGSGTAYSSYVDVLTSGNYSSYALPLSGGTITGVIGSSRNDVERLFESYNTSAGSPVQFFIDHSYGNVNIGNARGAVLIQGSNALSAGNYNSYAPTLTGGGASGTWSINITGSAGSATDNTKLPLAGGTMTGTLNFASADQSAVLQHNGNASQWYGRIVTKNSTSDRSAFLGTYAGITGVFAHNNALSAWAPLYVNTVDAGSWGGAVLFGRLQMDADGTDTWYRAQSGNRQRFTTTGGADFIIGNGSGVATLNGNQLLTAGNYTSYSPSLTGSGASGTWSINITGTATDPNKVPLSGGTMTGTLFINSKLRVNTASGPSDNLYGGATAPLYVSGADRPNTTILVENTSNSTLEYPTFVLRRTATPTSSRFGSLIRFAEKNSSGADISASIFSFNRLTFTDLYIDGGYEAGSRVILRASNHPNGSNLLVGNKYVYYGTGSQVYWAVPLQSFQTTLDLSEGTYFTITISSDSTFAFTYPTNVANEVTPVGFSTIVSCSFTLEVTHTGGTITWPASVKWPGNTAPSLTTGKTHLFMFVTDDSGSRWRGSYLTNYDN